MSAPPSLADGTVYLGPAGGPYAYLMQGGQRRAVPDATTLRDLGHTVGQAQSIDAAALAAIPAGAAYPSSSKFLTPPSSRVPLVLLPVRLETRFENTELWLRVYPDDIAVDSFEPELTADEAAARQAYLSLAATDPSRAAAFAALASTFGAARAAYLASADAATTTKASNWANAPFANVLPERWIVIGYQGAAAGQILAIGPPIAVSLAVGPAPNGPGPATDAGMSWLTDFTGAIAAGMAFRIPLAGALQHGFDRLAVIGLRSTLGATDAAARLAALLQAHHYTDGLQLLPHNAPAHNTETAASALATSDPNFEALFALEQGPALCPARPTADGDRLASALGVPPAIFAHVGGADGAQDEQAHAINTALWPATWGYYLTQIVTGAVPDPDTLIPAARDHFAADVRARGHFPALRAGRQPYGILPVCWSANWKSLEGRPLDTPLAGLLAKLRPTWESSVPNVPRIPTAADPEAELVALLGMTPASSSFIARSVIGPEYSFTYWNFAKSDLTTAWWTTLAQKAAADVATFGGVLASTRLANATYVKTARPLSSVLVAPAPLGSEPAPAFIASLGTMGWQALRDAPPPASPTPILFLLLRHAALRAYLDAALDLLVAAKAAQPSERIEAELVGFGTAALRPTAWDLLSRELPGRGPVGTVLDGSKADATMPAFAAFWTALAQLSQWSSADLDTATREVFDLASYRLDAWITSFAHYRLGQTRAANPNGGIVLGGYGWLENVRPQPGQSASSGFVHVPSLNAATTAAVLRSGYLSHASATEKPYAIDLSSARVRLALQLFEGVRAGQSPGALLGYRFERTLHDAALDAFIDPLRAIAPLDAGANELDVVDGLALVRKFQSDAQFWNGAGLPAAGTPPRAALTSALQTLVDALDSAADLSLAESVHQLTRGNTIRAGATLDSIARGDAPPLEIDFVKTPRSGTALTYRLLTFAIGDSAPGWTATPRAQAEPRLNAWAATLLGDPSLVRIRAQFTALGSAPASGIEIGLDRLGLAPLDVLALPQTQGIVGELADRICRTVSAARPATVPAAATIEILTARDAAWPPQTIGIPEFLRLARAVAQMVSGARAIEPQDLVAQGDAPGTIDAAELQARADASEQGLRAAVNALQQTGAQDAALLGAAAYGTIGVVPSLDASAWPAQIASALADLSGRAHALDQLAAGFDRSTATSDASSAHDIARLQAIFGTSFVVLPALAASVAADVPQLWANSSALQGGDTLASTRWMQRAARVRAGVARLDTALMYAESLAGKPLLHLDVAQLPAVANDRWAGLDALGPAPASTLSLIGFTPVAYAGGAAVAGLLVDEWIEALPAAQQITGVTFNYTDPSARAPQAILLAVAPDDFPEWTFESVEGSVLEALDLAALRGVDPDALGALGHYLPALYFAYNTGAPQIETVSIDFNAVLEAAT